MPLLQVKNCPERIYESLRSLAISEHRTIAQQVLAILDDYLNGYAAQSNAPSASPRPRSLYGYRETPEEIAERIERREKLFERIDAREPLALSGGVTVADIVRECREELEQRDALILASLSEHSPHLADGNESTADEDSGGDADADDGQCARTSTRTKLARRTA